MRHLAANFLTLVTLLLVSVLLIVHWGRGEFYREGPTLDVVEFEVEKGERLSSISERLADQGIIRNATIFGLGTRYSDRDRFLKFGNYKIPSNASMDEIVSILTKGAGSGDDLRLTIPEGFTVWQVLERLKATETLSGEITLKPEEGRLAPDTYFYVEGEARDRLLQQMIDRQSEILEEEWQLRRAELPYDTIDDALIMASIIEKETGVSSEREEVAGVFVNRLRRGMKLQTDPTVIYGITKGQGALGRGLRRSELASPTPYNTYIIPALPPTPIANPGRASIRAALKPAATEYLFFVADGTGGHSFAKTLVEHNANVRKWRLIEAEKKRRQLEEEAAAAAE